MGQLTVRNRKIEQLLGEFLKGLSPQTISAYRSDLNSISQFFNFENTGNKSLKFSSVIDGKYRGK